LAGHLCARHGARQTGDVSRCHAYYQRALALSPNEASILNNLALAHAMPGEVDTAEPLLKGAAAAGGHEARVSQKPVLVLGLQGKYEEAKLAAAHDLAGLQGGKERRQGQE
jgi:Flp pilus assembly protein TadD